MYKLNHLNYNMLENLSISNDLSIEPLKINFEFNKLKRNFKMKFDFKDLNTFSFSKEGFLSLLLSLKGTIAVSLGESEALINACKTYESLGFNITYISLQKDGNIDIDSLKSLDNEYLFLSSYIVDTFVKVDLEKVRELYQGVIISNISATLEKSASDIVYFDAYKLTGYFTSSVILHNDEFEEQNIATVDTIGIKLIYESLLKKQNKISFKNQFIQKLQEELKDNFFFFVQPDLTLANSLHFGLKNIKAREMIRNLSLASIFVTNGEGCSLGLSKPSRIIQEMGYSETDSRQALSLSFTKHLTSDEQDFIIKQLSKSYRQIKALNE